MLCFRFHDGSAEESGAGQLAQYTPEQFAVETRKLQILQSEFNALLKWSLCGIQISFICTVVFAICGSVWNEEGPRKLQLALVAVGLGWIITMMFSRMASIYDNSSENLKQWRRCRTQRAWITRFLKSTPPIRVLVGSYFYADKELVLTSLGIIAENSVTLLVSRRRN